jgi:hypothetical protein
MQVLEVPAKLAQIRVLQISFPDSTQMVQLATRRQPKNLVLNPDWSAAKPFSALHLAQTSHPLYHTPIFISSKKKCIGFVMEALTSGQE